MSEKLDRRRHAYRDDLADASLRGRVDAEHYVEGEAYYVSVAIAPLHPTPSQGADLDTEVLRGETCRVFAIADGWAWCQFDGDDYVGYVPAEMLVAGTPPAPTHKISTLEAFAYTEPTARSKPLRSYLFGSEFKVVSETEDFYELTDGGYLGKRHAKLIDVLEPDYVLTMFEFMRAPYLWGGKSVRGIDCSGLVQLALLNAGIECPRDTDMQERELPGDLTISDTILDELQRGDILYWRGHVGTMFSAKTLIHASGKQMSTDIEPVADVIARSRGDGPMVSAVKRLMTT